MADLSGYDNDTLVRMADEFNRWNWPKDLPGKPDWWDTAPNWISDKHWLKRRRVPNKFLGVRLIIDQLDQLTTNYDRLKYHWLHNLGRTEEEYKQWVLERSMDERW